MQGVNTITLNHQTLVSALEFYLKHKILQGPVEVSSLDVNLVPPGKFQMVVTFQPAVVEENVAP